MNKDDLFYRVMMVKNPGYNNDSIWKLQSFNDSVNRVKFISLTNKYGFPADKRIKYVPANKKIKYGCTIALLLHFTLEQDFNQLITLFEKELKCGNMPPFDFAMWYDRCQVNMKKENKYGAYGKKLFCGEELDKINSNRKEIGLEKLLPDSNCK